MSNNPAPSNPMLEPLEGPSPALDVARDLAKRALYITPAIIAFGAFWGTSGVASVLYATAIVAFNFLFAGWLLAAGARISLAVMMGASLFGYIFRLGLMFVAFYVVKDMSWMEIIPFGLTLIATHLVLLFWEMRYISGTLAFPGLQPKPYDPSPGRNDAAPHNVA